MILKPGDDTTVTIKVSIHNTEEHDVLFDIDYLETVLEFVALGFVRLEKKSWKK